MMRDKFSLVLLLLCFCTESLSNPIKEKYNEIQTFVYKGHIDTTTTSSRENLARWTISADLQRILHINTDYVIFQLEDIKTSLFNGNRSNLNNTIEKEIPEEAKILEQPFALKWDSNKTEYILLFKPNEPLWSINMKRGIANVFNFEYEKPEVTSDGKIKPLVGPPTYTQQDKTIYGNCMVEYSREFASAQTVVYKRIIDQLNCTQPAMSHISNTFKAPGADKIFDFSQTNLLTFTKKKKYFKIEKLESFSKITYKTSPSAMYAQEVDQQQLLTYFQTFASVEPIDLSEFTEKRELTYEFEDDPSSGRHVCEKDSAKLHKQFLQHFDQFTTDFKYAPVEENVRSSDSVYEMYCTLFDMDAEGLKKLEKVIGDKDADLDNGYIYFSLLPYVGTNASVQYLTEFYKSDKIRANEEFAARMLVTFPQYIEEPSEDKLVEMEGLMNNPYAQKKISKNAAVFGFTSAVGVHCWQDAIGKKYKQKYIDMFHRKYLDGQTYEEKMVYMLGLVNMADCLDFDFVNSITTNSSDSGDLRALAINGFKTYLSNHENIAAVYEIYWPLVQKRSEPFDVRVAALELLLSSPLNEEQFNLIIQTFSDDLEEPEDRHLANYVLTTIHSIQNTTGYFDHLGALASEAVKNANIHRIPKDWATGKYRTSYTDSVPNIGSSLEARVISDVKTNLLHTIEISFNSFGNSFDFGTYTVLVKFKGLYKQIFNERSSNSEVKESPTESYVELVLFFNNVAVYARHWDHFEDKEIIELADELDEFILKSRFTNFHIIDFIYIPSNMGTPITISNYMMEIAKQKRGGPENDNSFRYRSLLSYSTWIRVDNPLADAKIASYKYYNDEKNLKLNVTFHKKFPPNLSWTNEKDSYTQAWNNNMGVLVVEEDKLEEYCENCETFSEADISELSTWSNKFKVFGTQLDVESYDGYKINDNSKVFHEIWTENLHRYNTDALPYARPLLLAAHIFNYKYWLRSDLSKGSIRSRSMNGVNEITETVWNTMKQGMFNNDFKVQSLAKIKSDVTVRTFEDEVLSFANLTAAYDWYPDTADENTTNQPGNKLITFDFVYKSSNTNDSLRICGRSETNFPASRDDRLSIKPYEDIIGESVIMWAKNVDDFDDCVPEQSFTIKEIYSTNDKSRMDAKLLKDYEQCTADSKGLKFVAPTKECKRVSNRLTEYDNFQIQLTGTEHFEDHNKTFMEEKTVFEYSRIAENILQVNFTDLLFDFAKHRNIDTQTVSLEFYYPSMTVNPLWLAYGTDESINPEYARSTCTITPSTIEKLSGKYVPNKRKEWLAIAECVNVSTSLNGHTIDDKHVGFTYKTEEFVVVATVKNGHLDVTLNDKQLTEFYLSEMDYYFIIHFLGENVIYIVSPHIEIYYNTEYITIRTESMYPKLACGLCN